MLEDRRSCAPAIAFAALIAVGISLEAGEAPESTCSRIWTKADLLYTKLTDAYLAWSRSSSATVTIGKHSAGFTLDGMTSPPSSAPRKLCCDSIWSTTNRTRTTARGSGRRDRAGKR